MYSLLLPRWFSKVTCLSFQTKVPRFCRWWSKCTNVHRRVEAEHFHPTEKGNRALLKENPSLHDMPRMWISAPVAVALVSFPSSSCQKSALCSKWRSHESHLGSNSSIDTSRFPRYQKTQNTRLRKIMRGPEKTKKSQKLRGAKTPMKKRMRPAASRKRAMKKNSRQRPR